MNYTCAASLSPWVSGFHKKMKTKETNLIQKMNLFNLSRVYPLISSYPT